MVIAGDFHIDLNSNTIYCGDLFNMIVEMSFVSLITEPPTGCTHTSSALLFTYGVIRTGNFVILF